MMVRPILDYHPEASRNPPEPPPPDWFDYHAELPAIVFSIFEIGAFIAIHLTRNEIHEWAMCMLFSGFVISCWGIGRNCKRLANPLIESKAGAMTALVIYAVCGLALVAVAQHPEYLGTMNYADF